MNSDIYITSYTMKNKSNNMRVIWYAMNNNADDKLINSFNMHSNTDNILMQTIIKLCKSLAILIKSYNMQ